MAHGNFVCACVRVCDIMPVLGAVDTTKMEKKGALSIRHYNRHGTQMVSFNLLIHVIFITSFGLILHNLMSFDIIFSWICNQLLLHKPVIFSILELLPPQNLCIKTKYQ